MTADSYQRNSNQKPMRPLMQSMQYNGLFCTNIQMNIAFL